MWRTPRTKPALGGGNWHWVALWGTIAGSNGTPFGGWNVGVETLPTLRVVGPGRAGLSLCRALDAAGWRVLIPLGRGDDLSTAAAGPDLLVLAVPDNAV